MKLWIGKNYMKGAIAFLLLCGSLLMTAGVLAYGTESPATLFGITPNPENILRPLGNFLGMESAVNMAATVSTDRSDYAPGQIVAITGSGFTGGETVTLQVVHIPPIVTEGATHQGHDPWNVTADSAGNIEAEWLVQEDSLGQTLKLTADGGSSGLHAETTFTDSLGYNKGVFNKDSFPTPFPTFPGNWTTGNAGSNYLEDQWVYYQYQLAGIQTPGFTTPSFDVTFNHFQANTEAIFIDAFTNFRACVDCTEDTFASGPKQGMLLDGIPHPRLSTTNWKVVPATIGTPAPGVPIHAVNGTLDANGVCTSAKDPVNTPSEEHCYHVDGPKLQALFPGTNFSTGVHTITLFYEAHLSSSFTWRAGQGGIGHQYLMGCPSASQYVAPPAEAVPATVFGTEAYSGGIDPCVLESGDWSAPFHGVGTATGSSRHFNLLNQSAGSNGAITLPIPTVMAPTGSVTIIKQTLPNPAAVGAVFGFAGDLGLFNLDTDPSATNPSQVTFIDLPGGVPFSVREQSVPADWSLTNIVCTGAGTTVPNIGTASVSITLDNTSGAAVTCTFTNTLQTGHIIIVKDAVPNDPQDFTFNNNFGNGNPASFLLDDDGVNSNPLSDRRDSEIIAGTYQVSENAVSGWDPTSATCSDGSPVNAIVVSPGETVTCTFVNTKRGHIIIIKETGPNATYPDDFSFTNNFGNGNPSPFSLDDDGTNSNPLSDRRDSEVLPGNYTVSETLTGYPWAFTSLICSAGGTQVGTTATANITVPAGGTVTCTYRNTFIPGTRGRIIVVKDTVPNDATLFTFNPSGFPSSGPGSTFTAPFQLSDGQSKDSCGVDNCLDPSDGFPSDPRYIVTETANPDYVTTANCVSDIPGRPNSNPTLGIPLVATETVTCTFVNRKPDAQIDLSPLTATNRVNEPHTITATVQQDDTLPAGPPGDNANGFGPAPDGTLVTFSLLNNVAGATFVGGFNTCLTSGGTGQCSVQINTSTAGGVDIHATTTFNVLGNSLTRATGTGGLNSADAHKTYVDAQIDVTPLDATNRVNEPHTITATVQQDDGIAAPGGDNVDGFGPAPNGTTVTFSFITNTAGAFFVGGDNDCTTTAGSCSIAINSSSAGVVVIQATTTFNVGGLAVTRTTGTGGLNSANARKVYVDAQIDVTPLTATNRVNEPHTITATVQQDDGLPAGAPGDGTTGFGPAPDGTMVTFSFITNTAGATFNGGVNTCSTAGGTGTCAVTINAPNAGLVIVQATTTFNVGGLSITRTTGTGGLNSGNAQKVYVDAQIDISPLIDTNPINEAHTFTATVQQDDGLPRAPGDSVTGFGPAPNGTVVTFSFVQNSIGAVFVGSVNTCTITNGLGTCTVQINSSSPGVLIVQATTTFNVGGLSLTRTTGTGGLNSANPQKTYVDASITVTPLTATDRVGEPHTITAHVMQDNGGGFGPAPDGTLVTFSLLNNAAGATFVGGVNTCTTTAGVCSIQINTSTAGGVDIHASATLTIGGVSVTRSTGGAGNPRSHKTYVDAQIDVTPLDATNRVNEPHTITATVQQDDGIPAPGGDNVTGFGPAPNGTTVTFSFVTNTAGAVFIGGVNTCTTTGGSCSIQINSAGAGVVIVQATTTFNVGGLPITRTTGTGGLNSGNARKVYVDAQIDISPLIDTNPINEAHIFTATVQQDDGLPAGAPGDAVTGFGPAPNGTLVTFSFVTNTIGAVFVGGVNTCTTTGGTCTVQINSSAPGVLIVGATTTFDVGGLSLTRTTGTGGLNSANAQKTYVAGNIIVRKLTAPAGSSQSFEFDPSYAANFFLQHGQQNDSGNLAPGTYSVAEVNIPSGWDLTSATCSDGSLISSISLQADETVTCTFTNTKRPLLKLVKTVTNNNGGTAGCNDWDLTATGAGGFAELTPCGANATFHEVQVGVNYALTETAVHGYAASGNFSCDGGNQVGNSVTLAAGAQVTCTINNDDQAPQICVRKFTDPANSPTVFNFGTTGTGYAGFGISGVTAGNANRNCQSVDAGNYSAQETVPSGWILTGIGTFGQAGTACTVTSNDALPHGASSGSGNLATMTASMVLLIGDTVTCDFENTAVGQTTRTQGFWGTHTPLAYIAWFGGTAYGHTFPGVAATAGIGDTLLCGRNIGPADLTGLGKLMGGFWSDIAKKSTGAKRSAIDKSRMTLLQQLLAAELNASAFGSNPPGGSGQYAVWEAAFCGTDVTAINTAKSQAAAFNEAGDNGAFTPGTSADAQYAKSIANKSFWDNPSGLRGVFTSTPTTTGDGE